MCVGHVGQPVRGGRGQANGEFRVDAGEKGRWRGRERERVWERERGGGRGRGGGWKRERDKRESETGGERKELELLWIGTIQVQTESSYELVSELGLLCWV